MPHPWDGALFLENKQKQQQTIWSNNWIQTSRLLSGKHQPLPGGDVLNWDVQALANTCLLRLD